MVHFLHTNIDPKSHQSYWPRRSATRGRASAVKPPTSFASPSNLTKASASLSSVMPPSLFRKLTKRISQSLSAGSSGRGLFSPTAEEAKLSIAGKAAIRIVLGSSNQEVA